MKGECLLAQELFTVISIQNTPYKVRSFPLTDGILFGGAGDNMMCMILQTLWANDSNQK